MRKTNDNYKIQGSGGKAENFNICVYLFKTYKQIICLFCHPTFSDAFDSWCYNKLIDNRKNWENIKISLYNEIKIINFFKKSDILYSDNVLNSIV